MYYLIVHFIDGRRVQLEFDCSSATVSTLHQRCKEYFPSFRLIHKGKLLLASEQLLSEAVQNETTVYLLPNNEQKELSDSSFEKLSSSSSASTTLSAPTATNSRSIKVVFQNEMRRFRVEDLSKFTFENLLEKLKQLFPQFHIELKIQYDDCDGDRITVTTEMEFDECKRECSKQNVMKLFVDEGNGIFFKDGSEETSKNHSRLCSKVAKIN